MNFIKTAFVLLPYKITLLSNKNRIGFDKCKVLLPYKITLLSNPLAWELVSDGVLLPYKITLLSNQDADRFAAAYSFTTL